MAIIPYGSSTLTNTYTATLGTSWTTESDGHYSQTITVEGILDIDNPIIDVVTSISNYKKEQEAWGVIFKAETTDNSITFHSTKATEVILTLQIKVVR